MNANETRTMRDAFLERIYLALREGAEAFIVSADFGSPVLDKVRTEFPDRFVNVGIAEQNCINVATGLALEGFSVYAFGIAAFMSMRALEPVRSNVSLAAQLVPLNLNILGVGAGLSYDLSGPSHHCLEDASLMRTLPNVEVFAPSDWVLAQQLADDSLRRRVPKYFRLDSKPLPRIYGDEPIDLARGFCELLRGEEVCLLSSAYMTHVALRAARRAETPVGLIDVFGLSPRDFEPLWETVRHYRSLITIEEGFTGRGGLDGLVAQMLAERGSPMRLARLGVDGRHLYQLGGRQRLHRLCGMDEEGILATIASASGPSDSSLAGRSRGSRRITPMNKTVRLSQ